MIRRIAKYVFALVACAIIGRLVIVASGTESGWGFIASQWEEASLGLIGKKYTPVGNRVPSEQADFWLAEVDRILERYSNSAAMHMGAAWALDSSDTEYLQYYWRINNFATSLTPMWIELDEKAIGAEKNKFRIKCQLRCTEMAAKATELDSTDVRWWRMRALLLFESDIFLSGLDFEPRADDWLEVLDECKDHDPGNALYDYLAAHALWEKSANFKWPEYSEEIGFEDQRWILTVEDEAKFARGTERFLQAQEKAFLAIGEGGYPAITEFLEKSSLRKMDQASVAVSRLLTVRHAVLSSNLWRWQNVLADNARIKGDVEDEIRILGQNLRLFDQFVEAEETSALTMLMNFSMPRRGCYSAFEKLAINNPLLIKSTELDLIRRREKELRIETATLQHALQNLGSTKYPQEYGLTSLPILAALACTSVVALIGISAVFLLVARGLAKPSKVSVGQSALNHAIVWVLGMGASFLVFGIFPAEMLGQKIQQRFWAASIGAIILVVLAAAIIILYKRRRQQRFRFRLGTLFIVTTAVAVVMALQPFFQAAYEVLALLPKECVIEAKGLNQMDAEVLRSFMKVENGSLRWVSMQWYLYHGQYIGIAVATFLLVLWCFLSRARILQGWKLRVAGTLRFAAKSAMLATVCWLLIYCWFGTEVVRMAEANFQYKMRYCRDPKAHWSEIIEAQSEVESDEEEMKLIRQLVEFELSDKELLEKDFEIE